jgi:exopolyphosphatase / guanosine-5'-triphosphate,3'-diphosphate pyrophosphatase
MGTNSFHMIIARLKSDGTLKVIDKERKVIRLGSHRGEELSFISQDETLLAIDTLVQFKKLADSYKAKFKAVATSAVREANNKNDFIKKVKQATGISVEVIGGKTEAELIFTGISKAVEIHERNVLCIDIGGGSTEFINMHRAKKKFSASVKLGAVRLTKHFFPDFMINSKSTAECEHYIYSVLNKSISKYFNNKFDLVIGSAGTIESIASMILFRKENKLPKSLTSKTFTKGEFSNLSETILNAKTVKDRIKIKGMEVKRAEIIPAGVLVLKGILKLFNIEEITVSEYALREGVIFKMIDLYSRQRTSLFNQP